MRMTIDWYAPKSLEEAHNRRQQAVEGAQKLQVMIGNARNDPARHSSLCGQLRVLHAESRRLKDWIADFHKQEDKGGPVSQMMVGALELFDRLKIEDVDFDTEELALVEQIRGWCLAKALIK